MLNRKPDFLNFTSPQTILPKNKYGLMEQKFKSNYCLTRKEYENFTTYMLYFLNEMVNPGNNVECFKTSLKYANELQHMTMLPSDGEYLDDAVFAEWFEKCNEAQGLIEDSIETIFVNNFNRKNVFTDTEIESTKYEIVEAVKTFNIDVPTLDAKFKTNSKTIQHQRVTNHYSDYDVERSADFIIWQAVKGLLAYNKNSKHFNDENQLEETALMLLSNMNQTGTAYGLRTFMQILPTMWH